MPDPSYPPKNLIPPPTLLADLPLPSDVPEVRKAAEEADKPRENFINAYIAAFLGSFQAVKYEENCQRGWPSQTQPVEDAHELAVNAWEQLKLVAELEKH